MIDLEKTQLERVLDILGAQVPDCEVRVFGSRVSGRSTRFSDLDLVLIGEGKMDWRRVEALKDALSDSDLPIMVDVLDWHTLSESFQRLVSAQSEVLRKPVRSGRTRGALAAESTPRGSES
ncbi:MAG: nucleotidyltransferase domain-containing protein [Deltaproteobacteria bacterium]|nr:nucleotidyltransferase domain-containing protein [Deltaproteobacteria bacterium]